MIGNGYPWGSSGWVILEEGNLNPQTMQLDVSHYLVVKPSGETVSGTFTFADAKIYIEDAESKLLKKE